MATMMPGQATMSATYSFSSTPKAVSGGRRKYREPAEEEKTIYRDLKETCITWDKRVHRGNTYSMHTHNLAQQAASEDYSPKPQRRKRAAKEPSPFDIPLPEMERIPVDLTPHLVAKEEVVQVKVVEAQTDEFLPEPPPEQYQPQKTGVDVSTQVEDGELFHFDFEAEPILDVLVNKTIEQSIMEVEEEFEMERMKEFKEGWYKWQGQMMQDWEKQVAEEWVRWEQKEDVLQQKREEKKREARVLLKVQAVAAAKAHLQNLVPTAMRDLQQNVFPDQQALAIHRCFLPELLGQVSQQVQAIRDARQQVNTAVADAFHASLAAQSRSLQGRHETSKEEESRQSENRQIRRGKIRILMDDGHGGKVAVGPIKISTEDAVPQIEERVHAWLQANCAHLVDMCRWGVSIRINGKPVQASTQIFEAKSGQISMLAKEEPKPQDPDATAPGGGAGDGADAADGDDG